MKNKKNKDLIFLKFMENNRITSDDIFFTDDSTFNLASYFNRSMKIRISKRTAKGLKN